jgi:hypothetical protein
MSASTRPPDLLFEIVWLGWDREEVEVTSIREHDLTAAIKKAARLLQQSHPDTFYAHGFFVRRKEGA